jgi:uncharacterized protein YecE (DUF72 family)
LSLPACIHRSKLLIGCCGFPMARGRYFEKFPLVEVQQTFYQPPRIETLRKWRQEAPKEFVFTLKAWQLITHRPTSPTYRKLKTPVPPGGDERYGNFRPTWEVAAAWRTTLEAARALDASAIIFQSPASFTPNREYRENLLAFFPKARADSGDILLGWEPRGEWPVELSRELCEELGLLLVVDPFRIPPPETEISYFRLHGIGGYRYRYSDEELGMLASWCRAQTFCLFNNTNMVQDAERFMDIVLQD